MMKRSEIRIRQVIQYIQTDTFVDKCKKFKKNHFTRKRKMPLKALLLSILNKKGLTLAMELKKFYKSLGKAIHISKVSVKPRPENHKNSGRNGDLTVCKFD